MKKINRMSPADRETFELDEKLGDTAPALLKKAIER